MPGFWFFFLPLGGEVTYSDSFPPLEEQLDPADWSGTTVAYLLRAHGKTDNVLNPCIARLYNVTAAAPVAGSEASIAELPDESWADSAPFALAVGPNEYKVQHGCRPGGTATLYKADVLVDVA